MRTSIRRMGNSAGVIIPKPMLGEIGASSGDDIEMSVQDGRIILMPIKEHPRAGWADDSKALAASGEELAWPEFGNIDDEKLVW